MKLKDWGVAALLAILLMALNVALSFAWVFVYSLVEPGRPEAHYTAYAEQWAPVSSVVFGIPLMLAAGWFVARSREPKRGLATALAIAGIYVAIDLAILVSAGMAAAIVGWALLSWATKLGSAALGAVLARRRA